MDCYLYGYTYKVPSDLVSPRAGTCNASQADELFKRFVQKYPKYRNNAVYLIWVGYHKKDKLIVTDLVIYFQEAKADGTGYADRWEYRRVAPDQGGIGILWEQIEQLHELESRKAPTTTYVRIPRAAYQPVLRHPKA